MSASGAIQEELESQQGLPSEELNHGGDAASVGKHSLRLGRRSDSSLQPTMPSPVSFWLSLAHPTPVLSPGKIPWTEEPGRLQSMGSLRVGHDSATSLSLFTFMHWRRKWQPTPVFLPGESQGWGSLVGCRLWGRTESDTTEAT